MICRLIYTLFALSIATTGLRAQNNESTALLQSLEDRIASSQAWEAVYTLNTSGQPTTTGRLVMSGQQFTLDNDGIKVWFDGKTQWTLSSTEGEVYLSEPTADELKMLNPLLVIRSLRTEFGGASVTGKSATQKTLNLTSKRNTSSLQNVTIDVDVSTYTPQRILLKFSDGTTINISVNTLRPLPAPAKASFRFDPSAYPGYSIVDLR